MVRLVPLLYACCGQKLLQACIKADCIWYSHVSWTSVICMLQIHNIVSTSRKAHDDRCANAGLCTCKTHNGRILRLIVCSHTINRLSEACANSHTMQCNLHANVTAAIAGSWQSFRTTTPEVAAGKSMVTAPPGSVTVPSDAKAPQGLPCPWAGQHVGRSTKCPATRKSFKACCGKKYAVS